MECYISFVFKNVKNGSVSFSFLMGQKTFDIFEKKCFGLKFMQKCCVMVKHCSADVF